MPMSPGLMRNRGIFGNAAPQMAPPQQMAKNTSNGQTEKRGFDWSKLLGVLGDSLSIAGGGQATFVPGLLEQRQRQQALAYAAQQQEEQRQQGLQDWVWKQQYEAQNRPPTYFGDNAGNRWSVGADGKPVLVFRDPTQKYTQQVVTDPDGSQRLISIPIPNNVNPDGTFGSATAGGFTPPQAPVGKLKPYGGQSATPTGNFPR